MHVPIGGLSRGISTLLATSRIFRALRLSSATFDVSKALWLRRMDDMMVDAINYGMLHLIHRPLEIPQVHGLDTRLRLWPVVQEGDDVLS